MCTARRMSLPRSCRPGGCSMTCRPRHQTVRWPPHCLCPPLSACAACCARCAGADHVREKDGMWAVLCWLAILAYKNKDVPEGGKKVTGECVGVGGCGVGGWGWCGFCRPRARAPVRVATMVAMGEQNAPRLLLHCRAARAQVLPPCAFLRCGALLDSRPICHSHPTHPTPTTTHKHKHTANPHPPHPHHTPPHYTPTRHPHPLPSLQ